MNANYTKLLKRIKTKGQSLRADVQTAIVEGLAEVSKARVDNPDVQQCDLSYLSGLMEVLNEVRTINSKAVLTYIKASCSNLEYGKGKDGQHRFTKATKGEDCKVTPLAMPWWEHKTNTQADDELDIAKLKATLKAMLKRLDSHIAEGKVKGDAEEAARISANLKILAA